MNTSYQDRIAAEHRQVRQQRAKLAGEIAAALGGTLEDDARDSYEAMWWHLDLDGRGLCLHFHQDNGTERITVSGMWPREKMIDGQTSVVTPRGCGAIPYGENPPEITCATSRGAIQRRFLSAFVAIYDKCAEHARRREAAGVESVRLARELVEIVGGKISGEGQTASVSWSGETFDVNAHHGEASISFKRAIYGLPIDKARRILPILAEVKR